MNALGKEAELIEGLCMQIREDTKYYLVKERGEPLFYEELMGEFGHLKQNLSRLRNLAKRLRTKAKKLGADAKKSAGGE